MWNITLRNIQFRRRQFLIAVLGTALVFGMALLVSGIREGFRTEAESTLDGIGGDHWVVPSGTSGPFTSWPIMEASTAEVLARLPGVRRADPIVLLPQTIGQGKKARTINLIGHRLDGLGQPPPNEGRSVEKVGDAVVDTEVHLGLGDRFVLAKRRFRVVGLVRGRTYYGGTPTVYVGLEDAQALAYFGRPGATAIVLDGRPTQAVRGLRVMTRPEVKADLLRPLGDAEKSINNTRILLWFVAAIIVGAVMYMSALERVRDFAVLKAVGAATRVLVASLAIEAVIACLLSAGLAIFVARLLRPTIPLPVTYTGRAYAILPVVAVVVGLIASVSGVRRAVRTDPAAAFAGA